MNKRYVIPIQEILRAIFHGKALPANTVGITIDDGYKSIYEIAWPRFRKAEIPFTVFVSTNPIDNGYPGRLTWKEIKKMKSAGVTFGAHTASHNHMTQSTIQSNSNELEKSNDRFITELGNKPNVFAYPYGEASKQLFELAADNGYEYAFGQHL